MWFCLNSWESLRQTEFCERGLGKLVRSVAEGDNRVDGCSRLVDFRISVELKPLWMGYLISRVRSGPGEPGKPGKYTIRKKPGKKTGKPGKNTVSRKK